MRKDFKWILWGVFLIILPVYATFLLYKSFKTTFSQKTLKTNDFHFMLPFILNIVLHNQDMHMQKLCNIY